MIDGTEKATSVADGYTGPLSGVRVLEVGGIGPSPYAGMILADMGAEVIRIDRPLHTATVPRPFENELHHRGKKSVALDFKEPSSTESFLTLMESADVLIEGFRPGVMEKLGLGPDVCLARNRRLVYARMTGWGQRGPRSQTAGHDINYISLTGALNMLGDPSGPPSIPLNLVGDFGGGSSYLVIGVLAALRDAENSGQGQVVDAAIVDGVSHQLAGHDTFINAGIFGETRGSSLLDGSAPFYNVYRTADDLYMAVGAIESKFFAQLLALLELDFDAGRQFDSTAWDELRSLLSHAFSQRTRAEWAEHFDGSDACVTPVLSISEATADAHMASRGSVQLNDGKLAPGTAPRFSKSPDGGHLPAPPRLGEHTLEYLGTPRP